MEGAYCKVSKSRSTKTEVNEEQLLASYQSVINGLIEALPPYLSVEIKVNKTALKDFAKEKGITPAGVEFVENWSLRIR